MGEGAEDVKEWEELNEKWTRGRKDPKTYVKEMDKDEGKSRWRAVIVIHVIV